MCASDPKQKFSISHTCPVVERLLPNVASHQHNAAVICPATGNISVNGSPANAISTVPIMPWQH